MTTGRLFVVGTGIRPGLQLTPEARERIAGADVVFYLTDWITADLIEKLNPAATSLAYLYGPTKNRADTYQEMVDVMLESVRNDKTVSATFYGHPGVFADPGHEAIRHAHDEGYEATMLPGVSAADCLYADLGLDPGANGCQSFTGNDFVTRPRTFDVHTSLILWQIAAIGDPANSVTRNQAGIEELVGLLGVNYGLDHRVVLYVASTLPVGGPTIQEVTVGDLASVEIPEPATLYVPPLSELEPDPAVLRRLGLA